jgi:hypothetical protein
MGKKFRRTLWILSTTLVTLMSSLVKMLRARVVKIDYRWNVGSGSKVRFWEDCWIGSSSLAIQYWELYYIVNEQNKSIADLWDGVNLKYTFYRCVDRRLLSLWEELVGLVSTIVLTEEEDALI